MIRQERTKHRGLGGPIHEFSMNKSLGQNLLKNPRILDSIVEKAQLKSTDTVLEIGPGTGNLTLRMLPLVKKVIVVELDPRMVAELQKRTQNSPNGNRLEIIVGDVLKADLPYFDCCVANIPYNISSPLVFKLLKHKPAFRSAVIMFQKEFAMRLVARPGDELYCRLSINAQLLSNTQHILKIGRNNFRPPPKVDSSVVRITPHNPPPPIDFDEWNGLITLCFSRKNKTLGAIFKQTNVLKMLYENYKTYCSLKNLKMEVAEDNVKATVMDILSKHEYVSRRSRTMDIDDFLKLLKLFHDANLHFSS
mmetsp:Transcript_10508/g.29447  ORF Transcript_10508/g.29447 Transcript_10508/m.29447 type:complete len:307 (-) Transcript_10508:260-1180(-)|eukprot:CAMPEP_0119155908 /NCGR_PEP_ID=MMETSP1310-20130426/51989_1 /TAXON_ID=464262 /ORGANISM="Genus nov. species nov., Strain RCC2339" /LENGTH=306 /DNA_ID=CAMNT_0007148515 /DNA_START=22 /DNA_END=942 /DNA_ORIENTATION=+